jgi:hypothetical protein
MTEIKSTLDLVLERTKNLTMTQEEKQSLERKELEGRIRGWVKKYINGLMDLKAVKTEMAAIQENNKNAGRDILNSLVLEHIDVKGDNGNIFDLLEGILEESRGPYIAAVEKFQKTIAAERLRFLEALKAGLAEHGISGSAVMPNLDADDMWKRFQEKAVTEFRTGIVLIGRDS